MKFNKIIENNPRELIEELYINQKLSKEVIAKKLNICYNSVSKLINHYNLIRDSHRIQAIKLHDVYAEKFSDLLAKIPKDVFKQLYIEQNLSRSYFMKTYNITSYTLDKIIDYYQLHKSKKQSSKLSVKTKRDSYPIDNYGNWQKGQKTRIINSGSLEESYKQGLIKNQTTCLNRYGYKSLLSSPYLASHRKKSNTHPNNSFARLLENNDINYTKEFVLETKSYDFKVDDILIEIDPYITHNINWCPYGDHSGISIDYHRKKSELAFSNNYKCIHVFDWDDKNKIIELLRPRKFIYARNCKVEQVYEKQVIDTFLNTYHLQNTCRNQQIAFGLYYNNELIQLMTFGRPRYNRNYEYELLRLCSKSEYNVIGGAEKLFKYFLTNYNPKSIISYCDRSKFKGDVYEKLGMTLKNISVSKHWYNSKLKLHITDNFLRQRGFDQLLGDRFGCYGKGTSNEQLMLDHGFVEIYDAGQASYEYKI